MQGTVRQPSLVARRLEQLCDAVDTVTFDALLDLAVDILAERGWRLTPAKQELCVQVIGMLMRVATAPARCAAARRLATLDRVPPSLLTALAREPIDVAGPVLRHAHLAAADLLRILSEASPAHVRAIAERASLPEAITTLMILRGDRDALVSALANPRTRLAHAAFVSLVDLATVEPALRGALSRRGDLPDDLVDRLWPHLDAAGKARLLTAGFRFDPSQAGEIVREAALRGRDTCPDDTLLVDTDDPVGLAHAARRLAAAADLDETLALNLICGAYERGLVLLAIRAGLDEWAFLQIVCSRSSLSPDRTAPQRLMRQREETPAEEADIVLGRVQALWQVGFHG